MPALSTGTRTIIRSPDALRRLGPVTVAALIAAALTADPASAYRLQPYKDRLFAYPKVLETRDNGAYERVEYVRDRDLVRRDDVLRIRVQPHYVNLRAQRRQRNRTINVEGREIRHIGVGKIDGGANAIVVYLHGNGGTRFIGANDWSYGGNFNRIKNLMLRNQGLYISTDFTDFGATGKADVKALIQFYAKKSPGAPVFLGCTSMGGILCFRLLKDPEIAGKLGGVLLLGSVFDYGFLESGVFRKANPVPLYMGHGTKDTIYDWRDQEQFYKTLRARRPSYPVRFTLFETGSHGTPTRMTDWRLIINWMLALRDRSG